MATLLVTCGSCQHQFNAPEKYQGTRVKCPKCKSGIDFPRLAKAETVTPPPIKVTCGKCKREFHMPENFQGTVIKCAHCGAPITVPTPAPAEQMSVEPTDPREYIERDVAAILFYTKVIALAAVINIFAAVCVLFMYLRLAQ